VVWVQSTIRLSVRSGIWTQVEGATDNIFEPMLSVHFPQWLFGFLLCGLLVPPAQAVPTDALTGFLLTKWTQKDGLPGTNIRRIAQTPDGYLWVTTEAGLFRFDGVRFVSIAFDAPAANAPAGGLFAAADNSLWVGLVRGGVIHIQNDRQTYYPPGKGLIAGQVRSIHRDRSGVLWVGTSTGVSSFQNNNWRILGAQDGFPGHRVNAILEDQAGIVRIGSDRGVFRWEPGRREFVSEPDAGSYTLWLSEAAGGIIWVADEVHGLHPLNKTDQDSIHWKLGVAVLEDRHHNIWVRSFADGLRRISEDRKRERLTMRDGLSNSFVESLLEDREGNIWIGTQNGLNRLRPANFIPVQDQRLADSFSRDLAATSDGSLWSIANPLVYRMRAGRADTLATPGHFQGTVFSHDGLQPLLLASTHYLAQLRGGRFVPLALPKDSPLGLISDVARAADGGLWLADYRSGLLHWHGGKLIQFPQFNGKGVHRVAVEPQGRVWVGATDGLWELDKSGWRHYTGAEGGLDGAVVAIYVGPDETVWAASADKISRFRGGRLLGFDPRLPPGGITSMVEDSAGAMWITHSAGIFRITTKEWERAALDPNYVMRYRKFDEFDGLPAPPPSIQGYYAARGNDGRLWFALRSGVVSVDPARLDENRLPPPVVIEQAVADQKLLRPAPDLRLPPGTRSLEIDYTALSLTAPEKVRFKVKLEGFDRDWVDLGARRQVFYTNLSPRRYSLRVTASNNDGVWNETGAAWTFAVAPAFYQTSWFLGVCSAAGALMLSGLYLLRIRQLDARNRAMIEERVVERMRVARELHDSLLQNVTGLCLQIGGLAKTVTTQPLKARLDDLRRQAQNCQNDARESVWNLRSRGCAGNLAEELRRSVERLAQGTAVHFGLRIEDGRPRLSEPVERQILRIAQEAITNAVRHSGGTRIQVELSFKDGVVRLRISDNGHGFDLNHPHSSNGSMGLTTMRERAQQIGADFRIISSAERGTEIEATLSLAVY
jgi:signal transduction histidine kinase/ligand-binding sensor domain-containing protein